jgi:hypothetical protein
MFQNWIGVALLLVALGCRPSVAGDAAAPLPHVDEGACPFECCTYRTWTVETATSLHAKRDRGSAIAFSLQPGDSAAAVTGAVITTEPGLVTVLQDTLLATQAPHQAHAGDVLQTLHYRGEGEWLVWLDGNARTVSDIDGPGFRTEREPSVEWWVQIRSAAGKLGWTDQPENFGNKDACG